MATTTFRKLAEESQTYDYDSNHNRITAGGSEWKDNELNELLDAGSIRCTYDLNGNLTSKMSPEGTYTFTYDPLNRLTDAVTPQGRFSYLYGPMGRGVSRITYTGTQETDREHYLYDGNNEIGAFTVGLEP